MSSAGKARHPERRPGTRCKRRFKRQHKGQEEQTPTWPICASEARSASSRAVQLGSAKYNGGRAAVAAPASPLPCPTNAGSMRSEMDVAAEVPARQGTQCGLLWLNPTAPSSCQQPGLRTGCRPAHQRCSAASVQKEQPWGGMPPSYHCHHPPTHTNRYIPTLGLDQMKSDGSEQWQRRPPPPRGPPPRARSRLTGQPPPPSPSRGLGDVFHIPGPRLSA